MTFRWTTNGAIVLTASVLCLLPSGLQGKSQYVTPWRTAYPASTLPARMTSAFGAACYICHHPTSTSNAGTCYRTDLAARIAAGRTIQQAIADIDSWDSDGDGVSNHDEILMPRTDGVGGVGYHPGLVGATGTDPCGSNPAVPVTGVRETPPTPPPPCPGDINGDRTVNTSDLLVMLGSFGQSVAPGTSGDLNSDGVVNTLDLTALLGAFGSTCP